MTRTLSFVALAALTACGGGKNALVDLEWSTGDTFYLETSYKLASIKAEEGSVGLDGSDTPSFNEVWTEPNIWTYQVVESNYVPAPSDDLYDFADTYDGVASLAVIRASLDASLNDDEELLEADPVVYLVFREDHDRLAGVVTFVDVDGERMEQAYRSEDLDKSWGVLSQAMVSMAPTFLAPFGTTYGDDTRTLENGSLLDTVRMGPGEVDTFFDDELGGGLVSARYEKGEPWPTWTVTDNLESTLLTDSEVDAKRKSLPMMFPEAPEDFDYRAALATAIDIDSALQLDEETLSGGFDAEVYEDYQPWAGSWWPLAKGDLVFGFANESYSSRLKETIDPLKESMDELSEEIREMEDGEEQDEKVSTYKEKQSELIDALVDFYGALLEDLDGGQLTVANGTLTHDDGWSYEIDDLSPMDKVALQLYLDGNTSPNPFYTQAWELLNHYNPAGGSWWGHCNGWAAAAILTNEPTESVNSSAGGHDFTYSTADVKGLLTETHYSTYSHFYGQRYNGEEDDITDLTPKAFHKLVNFYIREQRVPLVFDTTASEAVWNFPAWKTSATVNETTPAGLADLVNLNTASREALDELPEIGEALSQAIIEHRMLYGAFPTVDALDDVSGIGPATLDAVRDLVTVDPFQRTFEVVAVVTLTTDGVDETWVDVGDPSSFDKEWGYTLYTDADGNVTGGEWDKEDEHPDFAWVPYSNPGQRSSGRNENPYLAHSDLIEIIGEEFERQ